jgi:hypothetical protein
MVRRIVFGVSLPLPEVRPPVYAVPEEHRFREQDPALAEKTPGGFALWFVYPDLSGAAFLYYSGT